MKQRMNRSNSKQSEFEDKVVSIKRVTKVVKGRRNFKFSISSSWRWKGRVGAGLGKASEIQKL